MVTMVRVKFQKKRDGKTVSGNVKVREIRKETYNFLKEVSEDVQKMTILKEWEE